MIKQFHSNCIRGVFRIVLMWFYVKYAGIFLINFFLSTIKTNTQTEMFYSVHVAMHAIICHIFATFWHLSAITCKIWQTTYSGEIIPKQNQLIRWCFFFFFQCSLYTYHINTNLGCLLLEAYFRFNPMPVYTEIKCSAIISRTCGFHVWTVRGLTTKWRILPIMPVARWGERLKAGKWKLGFFFF